MATWAEARAAKAERQRRERRFYTPDLRGPACRGCGFPTVAAITDPKHPVHPCCAEPELMRQAKHDNRRSKLAAIRSAIVERTTP